MRYISANGNENRETNSYNHYTTGCENIFNDLGIKDTRI